MHSKRRDFKGVWIPKEIWLSDLSAQETMLWAEINSLDNEFGCVAANSHFEETLRLKERQIREYLKRLKDKVLIEIDINKAKNTRTIRCIGKYRRTQDEVRREIGDRVKSVVETLRYQD